MMTNKEIADSFRRLASLMELYEENPYKIRSYQNAYIVLRKLEAPLSEMSDAEITKIKGVGKAIAGKIRELVDTGTMTTLRRYEDQTPAGIQEMLEIRGFGAKKIKKVWEELQVEDVGELLYACNENRLIELKGFGHKTQEELRKKLEYHLQSKNKFHYAAIEKEALALLEALKVKNPEDPIEFVGEMRRRSIIVSNIEILTGHTSDLTSTFNDLSIKVDDEKENYYEITLGTGLKASIYQCPRESFAAKLLEYTGAAPFLKSFLPIIKSELDSAFKSEREYFDLAGIPYVPPELRENNEWIKKEIPELITLEDLKGVLHTHTSYSDGLHSLEEMANFAKSLSYEYIGITDHSQSAFYANGLRPERVIAQSNAIDELNKQLSPFVIFKGIESDILSDGSLDYEEEILEKFDFIIASIHSNLRMDQNKATERLIKAIENPFTRILGHPTGRLLLSRKGYPVDHTRVIDACGANGVAIELNANPFRLDLDYQWIPYAVKKGVLISINPDAHSTLGILDSKYGIYAARKGGLEAAQCLNALPLQNFKLWLDQN